MPASSLLVDRFAGGDCSAEDGDRRHPPASGDLVHTRIQGLEFPAAIGKGVPPAFDLLCLGLPLACELRHSRLNVFENSHVDHGARTGLPGREEEALRAHADVGEGLQQACRNRPLRVSRRTLGKEALDTGLVLS